jgi:hypothetical protein
MFGTCTLDEEFLLKFVDNMPLFLLLTVLQSIQDRTEITADTYE